MKITNRLTEQLKIEFPMIMAPMFLVSNEEMIKAAMLNGIMGVFPSLNFRKDGELEQIIDNLNTAKKDQLGNFGINLIVQKSNPLYQKHLKISVDKKVPFYITSLGNPSEVIKLAHEYGAKVYCDVTNIEHAKKCFDLNCDGFIAVGQGAGGHAGPYALPVLIATLRDHFPNTPVAAAGGIANGHGVLSAMAAGADGVSVGTRFIASTDASVNEAYKKAVVESDMDDIVSTTKISGTPCNIINTPYAQEIGLKQNWLEKLLSKNATTKKWFKMLIQLRGMKQLEKSILPANYKTLWCAGQSVELIHDILSCEEIIKKMKMETQEAKKELDQTFS